MKKHILLALIILALCSPVSAATIYVDLNASGDGTGSSWANACTDIQAGVDAAETARGGDVWVAAGVYMATADPVVTMKEGVHLYGGFPSGGGTLEERDWETNETIIDSQDARGGVIGANDATFDGFVVRNGNTYFGSGMYNSNVSLTVSNCTFSENDAEQGGGMFNSHSNLTIAPFVSAIKPRNSRKWHKISEILDANPEIADLVRRGLVTKKDGSQINGIGANGLTCDQVLRFAIVKMCEGLSYRKLADRVEDSITLRGSCLLCG
ncbi:hypothetical protein ACFL1X_14820 [Candidatus Hydrogenedentota bacterium]